MYIDKAVPETVISLYGLKALFPKISLPVEGPNAIWLAANNYAPYVESDAPAITKDEILKEAGSELVDGVWQTKWIVRDKDLTEKITAWASEMEDIMSDEIEDIISTLPQSQIDVLPKATKDKYDAKVALRATKPV